MEIDYIPYKKVTFNSYLEYENPQAFLDVIANANPPDMPSLMRFFWANGILFRTFNHQPSESISKELLNGHLILDHIEFCSMPKYDSLLDIPGRPLGRINVINVTNHVVYGPLTIWIRDNLLKK